MQHTNGQTGLIRGTGNRLLDRLPDDEWLQIVAQLEEVEMPLGMRLSDSDSAVDLVYFPTAGAISTVATTSADRKASCRERVFNWV